MSIFFKPADGWAGDFIPFYWQGEYHLFYLKDYRNKATHGEGTPWWHISTRDFVHFTDYGEALPRGREDEQDLYVFTGCVIENEGLFHIYYTGHNPHLRRNGQPEQAIMHATSPDLIKWTKDPANPILFADSRLYELHDWRDPFVFWNADAGQYWMLLAARVKQGPDNRRGCTALVISKDLLHWEICEPLWAPSLYYTHECPDLFHTGGWWYLIYSTFSERHITHYRLSRTLIGPWLAPENDSFDGRAFYAAKTASDGQRRFAFGWDPTRTDEKDTGSWNWGGSLVVHEISQESDGSLSVHLPNEIAGQFSIALPTRFEPQIGQWETNEHDLKAYAADSFAYCRLGIISPSCHLATDVSFSETTRSCGVIFGSDDLNTYYQIRLEPGRNRVVFDRWPRPGDEPFMLERPISLPTGRPITLSVLKEGNIIVVYIDNQVALTARCYTPVGGNCGIFVNEGEAKFAHTRLTSAE
ncbi:MAG: family 43 glycosylhydrolase [Aggregatilineales bacterium]